LIGVNNISLYLGKEKPKLKVKSLTIEKGLWALVGRNGSGKSTFINALSGVNPNYEGNILIQNIALEKISAQDLSKKIAIVLSKTTLFGHYSALDVLNLGRIPYQGIMAKMTQQDKDKVQEIIALLQLNPLINKSFEVLSDGEKQLIMIGRALVQDTPIILLDEPTAFLDVVNRKKIIKLLANIAKKQDKTIVFSTHNIDLIEEFCDGMLLIEQSNMRVVNDKSNFKNELNKLFENEI